MEHIEVDNKDTPIEDIYLLTAQIFVDPYQEADEQLASERQTEVDKVQKEKDDLVKKKANGSKQPLKVYREGVGKYLTKIKTQPSTSSGEPSAKKKKEAKNSLSNFNSW